MFSTFEAKKLQMIGKLLGIRILHPTNSCRARAISSFASSTRRKLALPILAFTGITTACVAKAQTASSETSTNGSNWWKTVASHVDHTNLKITAKREDLEQLCAEAKHFGFASVCVQPCYVKLCSELLKDAPDTKVCTVVGFPHGYNTTETKVAETEFAVTDGATEIDMVINICKAKDGEWEFIEEEVRQVVAAASGNVVKVILETDQLTDEEVVEACKACSRAKSHYVKTSTGFNGRANKPVVKLMRESVPKEMKIKAAGGIRTVKDARDYMALGCSRLGMSGSVKMVLEAGAPPLSGQQQNVESSSDY